jgi:threonine dehydratase
MRTWIAAKAHELDQPIRPTVHETPIVERAVSGRTILAKQENLQTTGSFKIRGAVARLLAMSAVERAKGVITASTGNHGLAVAHAGAVADTHVTVYVPESAHPKKVGAIAQTGAAIIKVPGDPVAAEVAARDAAGAHGLTFISPYNDRHVVAGQGTVGIELLRQTAMPSRIIVAVGGGGLISGIGAVVKEAWPGVELVAASPENSPAMYESVQAGYIVDAPTLPTLSDGTAGGVEPGSITFELCRDLVDTWVLVSEEEIATTMTAYVTTHPDPIEGAAAVALAAVTKLPPATPTVAILCGGNA